MNRIRSVTLATAGARAFALLLAVFAAPLAYAERARAIPEPEPTPAAAPAATASEALDPSTTSQVVVLAGGCFWGVQGVFQHVKGVTSAVSGYAGGAKSTAAYDRVSTGSTGHAESVRVTFDPRQVNLGRILQVFFSVAHDPTQLNRQGPDSGTQYRSAVFASNAGQVAAVKAYIAQLNAARVFDAAIVTRVEAGKEFYPAEAYHQDYLTRHPLQPYIVINDRPKIANLKRLYPQLYRAEPVLVANSH